MFEPTITIDVDWAPDYMIESVAEALIERGVRATWLVTHASPAVDALRGRPDLFELGIHPNFYPDSTQGTTTKDVIDHCMALVPSARCVRTHGLLQSTRILYELGRSGGLPVDLSLSFRFHMDAQPLLFAYRDVNLLRLPDVWMDDAELNRTDSIWELDPILRLRGLKILGFHPVHVFLNCPNGEAYDAIKRIGPLHTCPEHFARNLRKSGVGPATMFRNTIDYMADHGGGERISDLAARLGRTPDHLVPNYSPG